MAARDGCHRRPDSLPGGVTSTRRAGRQAAPSPAQRLHCGAQRASATGSAIDHHLQRLSSSQFCSSRFITTSFTRAILGRPTAKVAVGYFRFVSSQVSETDRRLLPPLPTPLARLCAPFVVAAGGTPGMTARDAHQQRQSPHRCSSSRYRSSPAPGSCAASHPSSSEVSAVAIPSLSSTALSYALDMHT